MNILLADDDRVFQLILGRTLPRWGYRPIVVSDGEEAWKRLINPGGPSIAILDWVMPRADGLEVCRRIRAANLARYVYLILLTSKGSSEDLMSGLEAGADDYVPKPVNFSELRLRLRAGCRVLESEGRHRHIAENASDGIVTLEKANRIRFANHAAGTIFGYPAGELIGLNFGALAPDFERHLGNRAAQVADAGGDAEHTRSWEPVEIAGRDRGGRSIVLEVSFSESRAGEPERVMTALIRDVTERRRLDRQRTQAQKLESIGQLAAGVAHEINTPIQYVGDNLQFIQESFGAIGPALQTYRQLYREAAAGVIEAKTVSAIGEMESGVDFEFYEREAPAAAAQALDGVRHVAQIVRALKEFSHPGAVEMAPTDLNHLIETTVLISKNQWKYVAELKMELDPELPFVACVAGEVSQVLLNLVVNAADAIAAALHDCPNAQGSITIATRVAGNCAEIRVSDTGTGIPPAVQSRIFDPFFTTKDVGKGSGQGLALAYATVVQKHRGSIDFETSAGTGTTFMVRLPFAPPKEAACLPA